MNALAGLPFFPLSAVASLNRRAAWESYDNLRKHWESRVIREFEFYYSRELISVLRVVPRIFPELKAVASRSERFKQAQKRASQATVARITVTLRDVARSFSSRAVIGTAFVPFGQGLNDVVERYLKTHVPRLADRLSTATRRRVMAEIIQGLRDGEGFADIASRVRSVYSNWQRSRPGLIAETEVGMISALSEWSTLDQIPGIENIFKVWITRQDDRVRETHEIQHEEKRPWRDRFRNGLLYPREPQGPAREVINCRCLLLYEGLENL